MCRQRPVWTTAAEHGRTARLSRRKNTAIMNGSHGWSGVANAVSTTRWAGAADAYAAGMLEWLAAAFIAADTAAGSLSSLRDEARRRGIIGDSIGEPPPGVIAVGDSGPGISRWLDAAVCDEVRRGWNLATFAQLDAGLDGRALLGAVGLGALQLILLELGHSVLFLLLLLVDDALLKVHRLGVLRRVTTADCTADLLRS